MRKWLVIGAVLLQALVLAAMAGEREWILRTGARVWLRTAPVDPRDVFRGDYVRLDYEVSTLEPEALRDGLRDPSSPSRARGSRIYAVLRMGEGGLAELDHVDAERPDSGLFLRGRLETDFRAPGSIQALYGLEAMFVEQGKGLEIERGRGREGIQVPMEVEAAVSQSGIAVLKGWRWSPLGIGLEIERLPQPQVPVRAVPQQPSQAPPGPPQPFRVTLRLLNASERQLALIDLPGRSSFRLVPIRGTVDRWSWAREKEPRAAPKNADVRILEPNQLYEVKLDFADPEWALRSPAGESRSIGQLTWNDWFRLVYLPPRAEECGHLIHAALVWHGKLESRALTGARNVD